MSTLVVAAAAAGLLAAGYALGRLRPARRASDWANWRAYGSPTGLRFTAVWAVLTIENVVLIVTHPVQCWHAWLHRNDPPSGRGPAATVRRAAAPALDPQWAKHRHTPTADSDDGEDQPR